MKSSTDCAKDKKWREYSSKTYKDNPWLATTFGMGFSLISHCGWKLSHPRDKTWFFNHFMLVVNHIVVNWIHSHQWQNNNNNSKFCQDAATSCNVKLVAKCPRCSHKTIREVQAWCFVTATSGLWAIKQLSQNCHNFSC